MVRISFVGVRLRQSTVIGSSELGTPIGQVLLPTAHSEDLLLSYVGRYQRRKMIVEDGICVFNNSESMEEGMNVFNHSESMVKGINVFIHSKSIKEGMSVFNHSESKEERMSVFNHSESMEERMSVFNHQRVWKRG